jgi:8-oxoguanine deaminase|tara:strand:- start:552 stop:1889 length:1338 start_codon:yes stop_codon:yes gene_type:complete
MKTWIKNPAATWTGNQTSAENGIIVEGNVITELVNGEPESPVDEIYDAEKCVLLPGLVNCHHHFYQTLTRALPGALNKELFDWLVSLYPIWANLDEEAIRTATTTAVCELLLSGCTTTTDHHYVFSDQTTHAIDIQAEVTERLGIRAILTRGSMSLGKSDGGLPPDQVVQNADDILKDSERLIKRFHQSDEGAMLQIALAPCSPFSVTTELMRDSAILAREQGVLLHTHLAETMDENDFCIEKFGVRPVDYLEQVGWLANDVWLAHGIHFNTQEINRLGSAGVAISHCPSSNMILASGISPVKELIKAGCAVGIGVDGSASNDASNLIQELRQAFLIQRLKYGSANVSHEDALRLGTTGGAALFHRQDIGEIAVGKQADVALFNLEELRFTGAGDPIAALVLCGAHRAEAVMVAGKWRVKEHQLVDINLAQVMNDQKKAAVKLTG